MKLLVLLHGAAFGFLIAAARLNDYQVIHDMLLLREPDVFLLMGSAVGVAAPLLLLLRKAGWVTPFGGPLHIQRSSVTRDNVAGAVVFGSGWAIAGTCPIPAIAMSAGGNPLGLCVMAGLFGGIALRDRLTTAPPPPSCVDDPEVSPAPGALRLSADAGPAGC